MTELDDEFDAGSAGSAPWVAATSEARPGRFRADLGEPGDARPAPDRGVDLHPGEVHEPRRRWHVPGPVVLGAALLVGGMGASLVAGGALERERADRVAAQVGGLRQVADEPAPVWRAPTGGAWPAAVDGQVVIVEPGGAVSARDVVTGEEEWTTDLPAGTTTCGPDLLDPDAGGSPLVCVTVRGEPAGTGRPDDGSPILVTVLDRAGRTVGSRGLGDGVVAAAPLAGGLVATASRAGGGVVVTWEGALDGAVTRSRALESEQVPTDAVGSTGDPGASVVPASADHVELMTLRGQLAVRTADASVAFDADGDRTGERLRSQEAQGGWADGGRLPGDLSVEVSRDEGAVQADVVDVIGPDGRTRLRMPGEPFVPEITDGVPPRVVVVRMPGFTGYDVVAGRRLWHREEWPEMLWLQTEDVVVVESGSQLVALETSTGRELWRRWLTTEIVRVLTDGDSLLLVTSGDGLDASPDPTSTGLVSLNLFDGHVEWRRTFDGERHEVVAVQGMLFAVTGKEVVRLGRGSRRCRVGDLSHR